MSLNPVPAPEIPEATVRVARAAFPKGCLAMRVRDEIGVLFQDTDFAAAFPTRGGPGPAPGMLAVVSVMQFAERLTGRQAADAVRGRIDWKYLLGMELANEGFRFSVLSGFREGLVGHGQEQVVLDRLLARLSELGFFRAGGRVRTDATRVLALVHRRVHGELAALGVKVAASTVWEIFKAHGIEPAPERGQVTWAVFLRGQAEVILACDFIEARTLTGARLYVFAVIEHAPRRAQIGRRCAPDGILGGAARAQSHHGPAGRGRGGEVPDPRPGLEVHRSIRRCAADRRGVRRGTERVSLLVY